MWSSVQRSLSYPEKKKAVIRSFLPTFFVSTHVISNSWSTNSLNMNIVTTPTLIFECFTIVQILYGKSTQCTSEILNYDIVAFYFANFLT